MAVTVPGGESEPSVTVTTGVGDAANLAQAIADILQGGTSYSLVDTISGSIPPGTDYAVYADTAPASLSGTGIILLSGDAGGAFDLSGTSTIAATGGDNTVTASGDAYISTGAESGNNSITATGNATIATGLRSSTIDAAGASGTWASISAGGTNDIVFLGAGDANVVLEGDGAFVLAGSGSSTIEAAGSQAVIFGDNTSTPGSLNIINTGDGSTIAGFASNATIDSSGDDAMMVGGTGTSNITVSGLNNTVLGGTGAETITASSNVLVFGGPGRCLS
jgi:hypothetical protein